jgi:hypothetical protein
MMKTTHVEEGGAGGAAEVGESMSEARAGQRRRWRGAGRGVVDRLDLGGPAQAVRPAMGEGVTPCVRGKGARRVCIFF